MALQALKKTKRRHKRRPNHVKKSAVQEIERLFTLADEHASADQPLANQYVHTARRLAMKLKVKLSAAIRRRFCHNCHTFLVPSLNCRVRLNHGHMVIYCKGCKHINRFGYKK